jgi:DNA modification methylase
MSRLLVPLRRSASPLALAADGALAPNHLQFESVHPDSLKPYPTNTHTHSKRQIEQIRGSIRTFGTVRPIIVDDEDNILDGEAVWRAAKLEGKTSIPVLRVFGLTETQKRAIRIALNKHPQNADWDLDQLRVEMQAILAVNIDFDPGQIGMSVGHIDKLHIAGDTDPGDDAIPAIASRPISQRGDIWLTADHRIGCGDCRDIDFLKRVVGPRPVDCCITDPPYNRQIIGGATTGRGRIRHQEFSMASGEMSEPGFETFLDDTLGGFVKVSRDGAVHFICMDHQHIETLLTVARKNYSKRLSICVWNKSNAGMGGLYRNKYEFVGVFKVGEAPHMNAVQLGKHGRNRTTVWDYPSVNTFGGSRRRDLELHPTVKPTALVADAIMDVTRRGDLVLDGFLGSGTCLLPVSVPGACAAVSKSVRSMSIWHSNAGRSGRAEMRFWNRPGKPLRRSARNGRKGRAAMSDDGGRRSATTGRFLPNKSGNPRGRPRKPWTADAAILGALHQPITVTEEGRRRRRSKLEVTATQIANQGASGNLSAGKVAFDLARRAEQGASSSKELSISDREIADRFVARLREIIEQEATEKREESDHGSENQTRLNSTL